MIIMLLYENKYFVEKIEIRKNMLKDLTVSLTCVILRSKNAVCPCLQKSLVFISKRALTSVLEVRYWNFQSSQVVDVTHSQHLCKPYQVTNAVKKSCMLLCL